MGSHGQQSSHASHNDDPAKPQSDAAAIDNEKEIDRRDDPGRIVANPARCPGQGG
jgi:hypothetical protein